MIDIRYTQDRLESSPPSQAYPGDAGWDLAINQEVRIRAGEWEDVPTGISMQLPEETYARIVGRSSTWRKRGLMVIEGIIDAGFRGELLVCLYNPTSRPAVVHPGDRVAQVIVHQIERAAWLRVEKLEESHRGTAGFGSSG